MAKARMTAVVSANGQEKERERKLTLLRAVGLDRLSPEQRELALHIAKRYELDLLLKHLVMIEGRAYITRDGLLHVAHRSKQLDGIVTSEPAIVEGFWRATCEVYRKDMSHPFRYTGRYPTSGGNQKFAPEMAVKVGEVMALRRAFDVAAPTAEERWDLETPAEEPPPKRSLAERVEELAQAIAAEQDPAVQAEPLPGSDAIPVEAGPTHPAPASGIVEEEKRVFGEPERLPAEPGSDLESGLGLIR